MPSSWLYSAPRGQTRRVFNTFLPRRRFKRVFYEAHAVAQLSRQIRRLKRQRSHPPRQNSVLDSSRLFIGKPRLPYPCQPDCAIARARKLKRELQPAPTSNRRFQEGRQDGFFTSKTQLAGGVWYHESLNGVLGSGIKWMIQSVITKQTKARGVRRASVRRNDKPRATQV